MTKATYSIGSNNETKKLEAKKALAILNKYFEGLTAFEVNGVWKGTPEKTLRVEVITDKSRKSLRQIAHEVAQELKQEAVLLEFSTPVMEFIK